MLRLLEKPEGVPVGKPFVVSLVIRCEKFNDKELRKQAAQEAENQIIKNSISANAIVLGHYFPQTNEKFVGIYMAIQPYMAIQS